MRNTIQKIDRALKALYQLDAGLRAEDFLLPTGNPDAIGAASGALVIHTETGASGEQDLLLGIYLNEAVKTSLAALEKSQTPSTSQQNAFLIASEEVSHFHYLVHHARQGRGVSQFELELQGDIDKFLIAYFAGGNFDELFEKIFFRFRLQDGLSEEEKRRYADANIFAKRFIQKWGKSLAPGKIPELALRQLRRYYRLSSADKVSFISAA